MPEQPEQVPPRPREVGSHVCHAVAIAAGVSRVGLRALFLHGKSGPGLPPDLLGPTYEQFIHEGADPARPGRILHALLGNGD
jgi:hypothetical protein